MKSSLKWFGKFGEGKEAAKKIEWLIKKKKKGVRVKLLDGMPEINLYESKLLFAVNSCQTVSDIVSLCDVFGIVDKEEFVEIVVSCK